jgi:hypothetical protein
MLLSPEDAEDEDEDEIEIEVEESGGNGSLLLLSAWKLQKESFPLQLFAQYRRFLM